MKLLFLLPLHDLFKIVFTMWVRLRGFVIWFEVSSQRFLWEMLRKDLKLCRGHWLVVLVVVVSRTQNSEGNGATALGNGRGNVREVGDKLRPFVWEGEGKRGMRGMIVFFRGGTRGTWARLLCSDMLIPRSLRPIRRERIPRISITHIINCRIFSPCARGD